MNNTLIQSARKLRLSGLLSSLELRLSEAQSHQLPHAQFLELVFQDELNVRAQRMIERHREWACFRETKTLEDFDWSFSLIDKVWKKENLQSATEQVLRNKGGAGVDGQICEQYRRQAPEQLQERIKSGSYNLYPINLSNPLTIPPWTALLIGAPPRHPWINPNLQSKI